MEEKSIIQFCAENAGAAEEAALLHVGRKLSALQAHDTKCECKHSSCRLTSLVTKIKPSGFLLQSEYVFRTALAGERLAEAALLHVGRNLSVLHATVPNQESHHLLPLFLQANSWRRQRYCMCGTSARCTPTAATKTNEFLLLISNM